MNTRFPSSPILSILNLLRTYHNWSRRNSRKQFIGLTPTRFLELQYLIIIHWRFSDNILIYLRKLRNLDLFFLAVSFFYCLHIEFWYILLFRNFIRIMVIMLLFLHEIFLHTNQLNQFFTLILIQILCIIASNKLVDSIVILLFTRRRCTSFVPFLLHVITQNFMAFLLSFHFWFYSVYNSQLLCTHLIIWRFVVRNQ